MARDPNRQLCPAIPILARPRIRAASSRAWLTGSMITGSTTSARFFADGFRWMGNTGCGTKHGLKEFQDNWQRPFQAAFSDKVCIDEARLFMGEWAAAFGRQEAVHSGRFMGIEPTGKRVEIRYMDFWKVEDGKITDNWVMVDFPHVMAQLGVDVFNGEGWEAFDQGEREAPRPDGK